MNYDIKSEISILEYAKSVEGKSLNQFFSDNGFDSVNEESTSYNTGKGSLGQIVEEAVFGYKINSKKDADFSEVGMELKVVPLKKVKISNTGLAKREGLSVKERIVLSIIDYEAVVNECWENNSLNKKMLKLLLMFYIHEKDIPKLDQYFRLVSKWEPSPSDMEVLKEDWNTIVDKIRLGRAHELSEGDTLYLGAATKGSSAKTVRNQPYSSIPAKQRAFSLKRNYADQIFETLLMQIKNKQVKDVLPITGIIRNVLDKYQTLSIAEISSATGIEKSNAKHWLRLFCNKLIELELGEKFSKSNSIKMAGVELKTILLQANDIPKEAMSFEQIDYNTIVDEEWEDSGIREKFELMKHIWVVFKTTKKYDKQSELKLSDIYLDSIYLWNMPMLDLEESYKALWEDTVEKIGKMDFDNFMKTKDNKVGHIRPKAKNSKDKVVFNGVLVPKKAFWLNSKYVASEIKRMKNQTSSTNKCLL